MSRRKQSKPQHFWSGEPGEKPQQQDSSQQITGLDQTSCNTPDTPSSTLAYLTLASLVRQQQHCSPSPLSPSSTASEESFLQSSGDLSYSGGDRSLVGSPRAVTDTIEGLPALSTSSVYYESVNGHVSTVEQRPKRQLSQEPADVCFTRSTETSQLLTDPSHSPLYTHNTSYYVPAENCQSHHTKELSLTIPGEELESLSSAKSSEGHLLQIGSLKSSDLSRFFLPPYPLVSGGGASSTGLSWLPSLSPFSVKDSEVGLPSPVTSPGSQRYHCRICGLVLRTLADLGLHVQEHKDNTVVTSATVTKPTYSHLESNQVTCASGTDLKMSKDTPLPNHTSGAHTMNSQDNINVDSDSEQTANVRPSSEPYHERSKFNFHSPWQEFDSGQNDGHSESASKSGEFSRQFVGNGRDSDALKVLKNEMRQYVAKSACEGVDRSKSRGRDAKGEENQENRRQYAAAEGSRRNGTDKALGAISSHGTVSHRSSSSSRNSTDVPRVSSYGEYMSKHLAASFPALSPGFAQMLNMSMTAAGAGQWSAAMSKYNHANGYMQGLMAHPSMMIQPFNQQLPAPPPTRTSYGASAKATESGGLSCSYCGKVCPRPSILKRHMMMHTGERPFECKVCGQRFRAKGSMLFHQKLRHDMDVKLNKALEERYNQIITNQRNKQMREERKKAALASNSGDGASTSYDAGAWYSAATHGRAETARSSSKQDVCRSISSSSDKPSLKDSGFLEGSGYSASRGLKDQGNSSNRFTDLNLSGSFSKQLRSHTIGAAACPLTSTPAELSGRLPRTIGEGVIVKEEQLERCSELSMSRCSELSVNNNNNLQTAIQSVATQESMTEYRDGTPEPTAVPTSLTYDDNSNLKDNLDRMIIKCFSKLGLAATPELTAAIEQNLKDSDKVSAMSSVLRRMESIDDRKEPGDLIGQEVDYPGGFPGMRSSMFVQKETILVSRLEGVNVDSGKEVALFKCHLCSSDGLIFSKFDTLQEHLASHMGRQVTFYQCCFCPGRTFKFRTQLVQHLSHMHSLSLNQLRQAGKHGGSPLKSSPKRIKRHVSGSCQLYHSPYFSDKIKRRQHLTANKLQPFYCQACQRGFTNYFSSRRHAVFCQGHAYAREKRFVPVRTSTRVKVGKKMKQAAHQNSQSGEGTIRSKWESDFHNQSDYPKEGKVVDNTEIAKEIREKERLDEDVTVVIPSDTPIDFSTSQDKLVIGRAITPSTDISSAWSEEEESSQHSRAASYSGEIGLAPVRTLMNSHQRSKRRSSRGVTPPSLEDHSLEGRSEEHTADMCKPGQLLLEQSLTKDLPSKSLLYLSYLSQEGMSTPSLPPPYCSGGTPQSATPSASLGNPFLSTAMSAFGSAGLSGYLPPPMVSPAQQVALLAQAGLTPSPTLLGGSFSPFINPFTTPSATCTVATPTVAAVAAPATSRANSNHVDARSLSSRHPAKRLVDVDIHSPQTDSEQGSKSSRPHSRVYPVRHPIRREDACKPTVLSDGRTVYRCTYCNKDFATYSDVNRHMDFHEDIRPYKCKYCEYYARTNSQLKVHMMRHQGIRDFHCKLCNYKGVTQSDLNRHMKSQIHTMKAQNACHLCGEGFVSPKNLERHIEENHPNKRSNHCPASASNHASSHSNTPCASPLPTPTPYSFPMPQPPP